MLSTAVPLYRQLDTPTAGLADRFESFLSAPFPVFLDGAAAGPGGRRFSYISADPFVVIRSKGRRVDIQSADGTETLDADPFAVVQKLLKSYSTPLKSGLTPFQGGLIGYFGYELGHHIERLPRGTIDDLDLPEMTLGFYDWVIASDEVTGEMWVVSTGMPHGSLDAARSRLDWIEERLDGASYAGSGDEAWAPIQDLRSNFTHAAYLEGVAKVKDYIVAGDVYQVNLTQRFEGTITGEPWRLYRRLRKMNPAPFAAYLGFPEATVLSASPEQFLEMTGGVVHTRPMKGTRPRHKDPADDRAAAAELAVSIKDRAENVMIVDLMRNDLGRVCIPGTVRVPELFRVEQFETVHQMVSVVRGRLRPDLDAIDLLRACFPGGSVTGAPKIRAMEIIDELEPTQRSVYCGAIGYIGFDGSMLTSIPIRILLVKEGRLYFQVGGGIVYDSDPEAEYEETLDKARGSMLALGLDP